MYRFLAIIVLLMLITLALLFSGCGRKEEARAPAEQPAVQAQTPATQAPAEAQSPSPQGQEKVAETAAEPSSVVPAAPETVTLEAKMGKVTLPHRLHGEMMECATCHGGETPGKMELGKDRAHELCKGCHQEKGTGPTQCSGCHQK